MSTIKDVLEATSTAAKDGHRRQNMIYKALKERIVFCELLPGSLILETELIAEFHTSRTPVREALLRLEREGYIVIEQRKATRVSRIALADVRDVMEMRLLIEPQVIRSLGGRIDDAARANLADVLKRLEELENEGDSLQNLKRFLQLDYEFHSQIIALSGNKVLIKHLDDLLIQSMRFWYFMLITMNKRINEVRSEHRQVAELLMNNQIERAATALEKHIRKSGELECFE